MVVNKGRLLAVSLLLLSFFGCKKGETPSPTPVFSTWDIAVLNEGQMGSNNASITLFTADSAGWRAAHYQFEAANGQPVGDVLNSYAYDSTTGVLYLVVDNSKRIYQVNPADWTLQATLDFPDDANPRNLVIAPNGKGYVSSLFNGTVYVLDMSTLSIITEIAVEPYPDHITLHAGKLYVACANLDVQRTNNKLAVIDIASDTVEQYITLPRPNPGTLTSLPTGELLVECRGTYYTDSTGGFYWYSGTSNDRMNFLEPEGHTFGATTYAAQDHALYFVTGDPLDPSKQHIARFDIGSRLYYPTYLSHEQLQLSDTEYPYALRWHKGWLYIAIGAGVLDGRLVRHQPFTNDPPELIGTTGQFPGEIVFY